MSAGKTALIVVHGVADQLPGSTARSVVDLLVAASPQGVHYRSEQTRALTIEVPPLEPHDAPWRRWPCSPDAKDRPLWKAWLQSFSSDFERERWEAPPTLLTQARELRAKRRGVGSGGAQQGSNPADGGPASPAASSEKLADGRDRGLAFTDFLISKQAENEGAKEAYSTHCIELSQQTESGRRHIDAYEMYWADLSRLSGAIPRILTELGTFIFRLSRLGRDTVGEVRGHLSYLSRKSKGGGEQDKGLASATARWTVLSFLQSALDWLFVNVLAQLFTYLLLCGLMLVALGFVPHAPRAETLSQKVVAGVVGAIAALWVLYLSGTWRPIRIAGAAVLVVTAWSLLSPAHAGFVAGLFLLLLITALYNVLLAVADERFPFTRYVGLFGWLVMLVVIALQPSLGGSGPPTSPTCRIGLEMPLPEWRCAALFGTEVVLLGIKWFVIFGLAPVFAAWFLAGLVAQGSGYLRRASVATGRLGMGVSLCAFLLMGMALWALMSVALDFSLKEVRYDPAVFKVSQAQRDRIQEEANSAALASSPCGDRCPPAAAPKSEAQFYLIQRYKDSTSSFAPLALLFLVFLVFAAVTLVPSLLAELGITRHRAARSSERVEGKPAEGEPLAASWQPLHREQAPIGPTQRLGRWLTKGYRMVNPLTLVICALGSLLLVIFALFLACDTCFLSLRARTTGASQDWLKPFVLSAAGLAAALSLFGGVLSRYAPALRAPLDVALDVDNYFREFPRRQIPRARIFARYVALLDHVASQGYGRIVITAHSQGCVISAEVLRWLSHRRPDRATSLFDPAAADVRLLTVGNPLRQLYAARFPTLYGWVIATIPQTGVCGPRARDLGVRQWLNAYTSGDYVGRWLWSGQTPPEGAEGNADNSVTVRDMLGHPLADVIEPAQSNRGSAYDDFLPEWRSDALDGMAEAEACIGVGAHTHYFEPDQVAVARLIDYLLRAPAGPGEGRGDSDGQRSPAAGAAARPWTQPAEPWPNVNADSGQPREVMPPRRAAPLAAGLALALGLAWIALGRSPRSRPTEKDVRA